MASSSSKGRTLVTGVASGFGEAIARHFIAHHWQVIGTRRRLERLHALQKDFNQKETSQDHSLEKDFTFIPLCFDVSQKEAVHNAIQGLELDEKPLDILVNNAGLALGLGDADEVN